MQTGGGAIDTEGSVEAREKGKNKKKGKNEKERPMREEARAYRGVLRTFLSTCIVLYSTFTIWYQDHGAYASGCSELPSWAQSLL